MSTPDLINFEDAFQVVSVGKSKLQSRHYKEIGKFPVVDQGQYEIAGYTDDENLLRREEQPLILFGDHTRNVKYITFPFVVGADGVRLYRARKGFDPEYLFYFLKSVQLPNDGYGRHSKHLEDLKLAKLTLQRQRLIASRLKAQLAAVEEARQSAENQLNDAQRLTPATLELAFSEFAKSSFVKLSNIANIQLGKMLSPKSKTGKQSFTYLRNTNVQWGRFDLRDLAVMDFSDRERVKFELQTGDLIVCEGGEPGRCAVWNAERTDCYYQKALHRVRPHKEMADSEFLSYWVRHQAYVGSFEDQNAKTTIAHLPLVRLEQLPIPNIQIEEQRCIAESLRSRLAAVDEILLAAQAQLEEVRRLPSRLLAQAFEETDHAES